MRHLPVKKIIERGLKVKGFFLKRLYILGFVLLIKVLLFAPIQTYAQDIDRIYGNGRYETAVAISKEGWLEGARYVVLARGDLFADALAGAPFAASKDAPILLTYRDRLQKKTIEEIKRLNPEKIYILGGPQAISEKVEKEIESALKITNIERIYGNTRYETAEKIARRLGMNKDAVILATGENFPDALSIAPFAGQNQFPILLTEANRLPDAVNKYLKEAKNIKKVYVIGGEKAISPDVIRTIENIENIENIERISGNTRYETSIEILSRLYDSNETIYISTGLNFADALTGSVLAAKNKTGILLLDQKSLNEKNVEQLIKQNLIKDFTVLGGAQAVPDHVAKTLNRLLNTSSHYIGSFAVKPGVRILNDVETKKLLEARKIVNTDGTLTIETDLAKSFREGQVFMIKPGKTMETGLAGEVRNVNKSKKQITVIQPSVDKLFEKAIVKVNEINVSDESSGQDQINLNNIKSGNLTTNGTVTISNITASANNQFSSRTGLLASDLKLQYTRDANFEISIDGNFSVANKFFPELNESLIHLLEGGHTSHTGHLTYKLGDANLIIDNQTVTIPVHLNLFASLNVHGEGFGNGILTWNDIIEQEVALHWDYEKDTLRTAEQRKNHEATMNISGNMNSDLSFSLEVNAGLSIAGVVPLEFTETRIIESEIDQSGTAEINLLTDFVLIEQGYLDGSIQARDQLTAFTNYSGKTDSYTIQDLEWYAREISAYENTGDVLGVVHNARSGGALDNVKITAYKNGNPIKTVYTDKNGEFSFTLPEGIYSFTFEKNGYVKETYYNMEIYNKTRDYFPIIQLVPEAMATGTVSGKIVDAISKEPLEEAQLIIRKGYQGLDNDGSGDFQEALVQQDGSYSLNLPGGNYTIEVHKEGYVPYRFFVTSIPGQKVNNQNGFVLSTREEKKLGLVLTWRNLSNDFELDLDLHLNGILPGGEKLHLYWDHREFYLDDELIGNFETEDARTGLEPEVITIHDFTKGEFRISVFNYSYRLHNQSMALGRSFAKLDLYQGNKLVDTFFVPVNRPGKLWHVLHIKDGEFVPLQSITDEYTFGQFGLLQIQRRVNVNPFLKEKQSE